MIIKELILLDNQAFLKRTKSECKTNLEDALWLRLESVVHESDEYIHELETNNQDLEFENEDLHNEVEELNERIEELENRIKELEDEDL